MRLDHIGLHPGTVKIWAQREHKPREQTQREISGAEVVEDSLDAAWGEGALCIPPGQIIHNSYGAIIMCFVLV